MRPYDKPWTRAWVRAYRKIRGKINDWDELLNLEKRARRKARATQRPVGVPRKDPRTEALETRPEEPLITTRTRQVPGTL